MKYKIIICWICLSLFIKLNAQDILIYQPQNDGEIKVFNSKKEILTSNFLHRKQGDKIKINLINPNPLFYKYEISYEEQKENTEDKVINDAVALLNAVLASQLAQTRSDAKAPPFPPFEEYKTRINRLLDDIKDAQKIIEDSDNPESVSDALNYSRENGGLRYAIDQIKGNANPITIKNMPGDSLKLSNKNYRFRSTTLKEDLDDLAKKAASNDETLQKALILLNNSLVEKVNEIKKNINEVKSELISEFVVNEKTTKIFLTIHPLDPKKELIRKVNDDKDDKTEIVTIVPDYKRATLELVPVGSFLFAKEVKEFYLENNLVYSQLKNKTTFTAGVILNINIATFGLTNKEMAVGIGPGYRLNDLSNGFENFNLSALFSYKNFIRIGLGFGFAKFPNSLKNNIKEGDPLPSNITNIGDIIDYKEKLTGFLSISFTGLNLSKK